MGFRLMLRETDHVRPLIIQNSEAYYDEGRSTAWAAMEEYWRDPSPARRNGVREAILSDEGIRREFTEQLPPELVESIDPAVIELARAHLDREGVVEAMLDLHRDYRSNVELYPKIQAWLREYGPAAAEAYRRDLPEADVRIIGGGHWAIETNLPEVAAAAREFLDRQRLTAPAPSALGA